MVNRTLLMPIRKYVPYITKFFCIQTSHTMRREAKIIFCKTKCMRMNRIYCKYKKYSGIATSNVTCTRKELLTHKSSSGVYSLTGTK